MRGREKDMADRVKNGENINYSVESVYKGNNSVSLGMTIKDKGDDGYYKYLSVRNKLKGNMEAKW